MVSISPALPSSTSWWATRPRSRTECTGMPCTRAPRAPRGRRWSRRDRGEAGVLARGADQVGGACGGSRGGVDLVGVVQLDDLDGLVEPGGPLRRTPS